MIASPLAAPTSASGKSRREKAGGLGIWPSPEAVRLEMLRRFDLARACEDDPRLRHAELERCKRDVLHWMRNWVWTYDPRVKPAYRPFIPFPRQEEYLIWLSGLVDDGEEGVCEKSRDVGASYMNAVFALHRWLFHPGFKVTFGANKATNVDEREDPDSIFEKIRLMLERLPTWMLPAGFLWRTHSAYMRLVNPRLRSSITGQCGDDMGRGGRSTLYVIDEAAHVARASKVDRAVTANTEAILWASSVNGEGNLFARKARTLGIRKFRFHYSADPRKTPEWIAKRKAKTDPVTWAQEWEIDYGASVEGLIIPRAWVDAAIALLQRLGLPENLPRARVGFDVGAGKAESAAVARQGPFLHAPRTKRTPDTVDTAWWALEVARELGAELLTYDATGVGHHVLYTLQGAETVNLSILPSNAGDPPSDAVWPDGKTSKAKFANLKAETWWKARGAFQRSYLHLRYLDDEEDGVECERLDELVLMSADEELARQLSTPTFKYSDRGKIMVEGKDSLKKRGIASPDRADAAMLTWVEPPLAMIGGL